MKHRRYEYRAVVDFAATDDALATRFAALLTRAPSDRIEVVGPHAVTYREEPPWYFTVTYGATQGMDPAGMGMGGGAYGSAQAGGTGSGVGNGLLHNLQGLVGNRQTEQFLLGALLGAAAVYVLGDEAMRAKLMKTAMKLYTGVAGGFEEVKDQMADI